MENWRDYWSNVRHRHTNYPSYKRDVCKFFYATFCVPDAFFKISYRVLSLFLLANSSRSANWRLGWIFN